MVLAADHGHTDLIPASSPRPRGWISQLWRPGSGLAVVPQAVPRRGARAGGMEAVRRRGSGRKGVRACDPRPGALPLRHRRRPAALRPHGELAAGARQGAGGAGPLLPSGLRRTGGVERRQRLDLPAGHLARPSGSCLRVPDREAGRAQAVRPHRGGAEDASHTHRFPLWMRSSDRGVPGGLGRAGVLHAPPRGAGAAILRPRAGQALARVRRVSAAELHGRSERAVSLGLQAVSAPTRGTGPTSSRSRC